MPEREDGRASRFFRDRDANEEQRATWLELFFDLVFVFAVTQLSHFLLEHLTLEGAAKTLFLLLVVWWGWGYATWTMNWFDPDLPAVRMVLILSALASLFIAIAIPEAFGDRALMFAAAYTALQTLRMTWIVLVLNRGTRERDNFTRILAWFVVAGAFWIAGALVEGDSRIALWLVALALEYAAPLALYWTPRLGRADTSDWSIDSSYFAERFQLFVIIVLGESIVVTGATASGLEVSAGWAAAIAVAFLSSSALWWLYFDYVARVATWRLGLHEDRGRLGRDAYTYLHIPLIAGIIVAAVGDELVITHPGDTLSAAELATVVGGPALYLLGHVGFRLRMAKSVSWRRLSAAVVLVPVGFLGAVVPALAVAVLVLAVLVALIGWEMLASHRRRARGEASPLERLEEQAATR